MTSSGIETAIFRLKPGYAAKEAEPKYRITSRNSSHEYNKTSETRK
jgi:hypothetical protein